MRWSFFAPQNAAKFKTCVVHLAPSLLPRPLCPPQGRHRSKLLKGSGAKGFRKAGGMASQSASPPLRPCGTGSTWRSLLHADKVPYPSSRRPYSSITCSATPAAETILDSCLTMVKPRIDVTGSSESPEASICQPLLRTSSFLMMTLVPAAALTSRAPSRSSVPVCVCVVCVRAQSYLLAQGASERDTEREKRERERAREDRRCRCRHRGGGKSGPRYAPAARGTSVTRSSASEITMSQSQRPHHIGGKSGPRHKPRRRA